MVRFVIFEGIDKQNDCFAICCIVLDILLMDTHLETPV